MDAWRIKMKAWRVCRPVVANLHHFLEEQDPDPFKNENWVPEPHLSEKRYADPH